MFDRRIFLKSSGLALFAGGFLPNVFLRMAEAGTAAGRRTLVAIFQRGAVDGLNVVVPHGEKLYYDARPTIAVPRPGAGDEAAIDLDGFFGLHPAMEPLLPFYRNGLAAFVHAAGSPDATRSHFDAQDFMESGTPGVKTTADGFLSRAVAGRVEGRTSPLRAVSLTPTLPRILSGSAGAVTIPDLERFGVGKRGDPTGDASRLLESLYDRADPPLRATARESFEAMRLVESARAAGGTTENGAEYPPGPFGAALRQIARLIRADVGLEVAFADVGGWDTHAGEGGTTGQLSTRLRAYSAAIAAFARDLGPQLADVTLVTMSEFGRTVRENGNRGTDHGHANAMLVLGGGVRGGRVYGKWPGLDESHLFENRDVAVTTDFRDVFAEILARRLGVRDLDLVFPGYRIDPRKRLGLVA